MRSLLAVLFLLPLGCAGRGVPDIELDTGADAADDDDVPPADCDPSTGSTTRTTWYLDADHDGYGTNNTTAESCGSPGCDFVALSGDCDDTTAAVHPDTDDVCEDGVDNDCDGEDAGCSGTTGEEGDLQSWEDASIVSSADWTMLGDTRNGYFGSTLTAGDIDQDGNVDIVVGAYGEQGTGSTNNTGEVRVFYGPIDPSWTAADAGATMLGAQTSAQLGVTATVLGDGTLALGANHYDDVVTGTMDGGAVLVFADMGAGDYDSTEATGIVVADHEGDQLGVSITEGSDSDGAPELIVGAYAHEVGALLDAGAVAVIPGPVRSTTRFGEAAETLYTGVASGDGAGFVLSGGSQDAGDADVDGDGLPDLLIGAPGSDLNGAGSGAAYLVLGGGPTGTISLASADGVFAGAAPGDSFGRSLSWLGDTDGDGYADFAISADAHDEGAEVDVGAVYVWSGGPAGAWSGSRTTTSATASFTGEFASDYAGRVVAAAGDTNGDELNDLLVSATGFDNGATTGVGAGYLLCAPFEGAGDLSTYSARIRGSGGADAAGYTITGLGDTNADGLDDIGMTGIAVENGSTSNAGSSWLFFGRPE